MAAAARKLRRRCETCVATATEKDKTIEGLEIMFHKVSVIFTITLLVMLASCTTSTVTSVDGNSGNVYVLPAEVVDRMLLDAMSAEIPKGGISRGSTPYPSYSGDVKWGSVDTDTITAMARPATGRRTDGGIVQGFVFEVQRHGSAPATGSPTAKRIHAKLQTDAELTSER
jgi:hypothetical protein